MRSATNRGTELTLLLTNVSLSLPLTIKDANGAIVDLTDATLQAQIRRFTTADAALVELDVEVADAETGAVVLSLSAAVAAALDFDQAKWSLLVTDSDGVVSEAFHGDVFFEPGPTR